MDTIILSDWLHARLDRAHAEPMYRQVLDLMQQAILTGQLAPGTKLPSSRTLASDLEIARNTVLHVYDQLTAEGYVISSTGSGTYVADTRPQEATPAAGGIGPRKPCALSRRGARLIEQAGVSPKQWGAFMPGVPDVAEFPARTWSRLQARLWKRASPELLTYAPGGGYRPLRRALSDYLRVARSVNCSPDQIIITTGIHQSIDLAVRLLTDVGDRAWVEEPCYWGVRSVLQSSGLTLVPIAVDDEGLNPLEPRPAAAAAADARHAVASISARDGDESRAAPDAARIRAAARRAGSSRTTTTASSATAAGRSRRCKDSMTAGQVIYVGSFGKTLFPGLRIGYMVVPERWSIRFATASPSCIAKGSCCSRRC